MDESYIHTMHSSNNGFYAAGECSGQSSFKGRKIVIVHVITEDGPLVELDDLREPINNLNWTGDTPHPKDNKCKNKTTCELLWIAHSWAGDYHDNMSSHLFLPWVENRLIPVFQRRYPGKHMVLCLDNAPYHHSRGIPSLLSLNKEQLVNLMEVNGVKTFDLPIDPTFPKRTNFSNTPKGRQLIVEFKGHSYIRVPFDVASQKKRCNNKDVTGVNELRTLFVKFLKHEKPEVLECRVKKMLRVLGFYVL